MREYDTCRSLPALAIVVLLSTLFVYRPETVSTWYQTLYEWLHVPVFGFISLALLSLMPKSWPGALRLFAAFTGSVFLAVASEAAQIPLGRSAEAGDVIADAQGAASFLLIAATVGRRTIFAVIATVAAAAIVAWSALPLISVSRAVAYQISQFPVIYGGDFRTERTFITIRNTNISTGWDSSSARRYSRIVFPRGRRSGIEFRDLVGDWSDYSSLNLDIYVEGSNDLRLVVRIHDKAHRRGDQPHSDRYNQRFRLPQGHNSLRIPLDRVKEAPQDRVMDMKDIEALVIFSAAEDSERVFKLFEIRLD